jgi:hypothetical protein
MVDKREKNIRQKITMFSSFKEKKNAKLKNFI